MRLDIKSCIAFFNKIEFVVSLNVGKFEHDFAWRRLQTPKRL